MAIPLPFDPTLPLEQARTIPNTWYFDPHLAETEKSRIFAQSWQCVGRVDQVQKPGAFLTAEIAGEPILVVRDNDGVLRAFFNVCRHRAAPILNDPCGQVDRLRCRYHGWTYDLAGHLRGVPEFDGVQNFCREDNGLVPLAVETWGPLVWVHVQKPDIALEQALAPMPAWCRGRPIHQGLEPLQFFRRQEYVLNCNWKVYVDNYLDGGYHVNTVHPGLAGVLDYREYQTHIYDQTSVQTSPLKAGDPNDVTTRTRTGDLAAYWWVFPNFMLNLYEGIMDTNLVLPLGPGRCKVIFDFYFAESIALSTREESITVANQIQQEDVEICEQVQLGLASRSFSTGRFSVRREKAGYHFHQLLGRQLQTT